MPVKYVPLTGVIGPSDFCHVFAACRVVLGDREVDRAQQVLKLRTSERHGLNGAVIQRAVRPDKRSLEAVRVTQ